MREEIYKYLKDYGLKAIELDEIEKENEEIFFTNINEIRKNITFLEEKYLEREDVINLINENPFMLTEKNNRLEALDEIYNGPLRLDYESLKELLKNNSEAYTISPIELQKIINHMTQQGYTIENIREIILKNPKIISMKSETFIKALKKD